MLSINTELHNWLSSLSERASRATTPPILRKRFIGRHKAPTNQVGKRNAREEIPPPLLRRLVFGHLELTVKKDGNLNVEPCSRRSVVLRIARLLCDCREFIA